MNNDQNQNGSAQQYEPHIDPEQYAAALARAAQLENVLDGLTPFASRIKRMQSDPNYVKMLDDADVAYEAVSQQRKPRIPEELAPIDARLSKLEEAATTFLDERKALAEKPQKEAEEKMNAWAFSPSNERFYQRLRAEHPDLFANEKQAKRMMANLADEAMDNDYAPLETIWKENEWRYVRGERPTPPPSSLPPNAGDVGIPGSSTNGSAKDSQLSPQERMRRRVVELETNRRRTA